MDFFAAQDRARSRTKTLVLLFALAVAGIIAAVYFLLVGIYFAGTQAPSQSGSGIRQVEPAPSLWQPDLLLGVAVGVSVLVGGASLFKIMALKAGGGKVAESVGGRPVSPDTNDPAERRLLNVVEEMAIASGIPMPGVYVLDQENNINAFAAGYTVEDAAVAVTRGTLEKLNRDELQGVIAHEFSHILNGDMRINIRLIGIIFGILLLTLIGRIILHSSFYRSGRDSKGKMAVLALGFGVIVIGSIGVFFGRMIQAMISRQREYLADSSAVQFTRNPDGLGGALIKIGALSGASTVENPHANEIAHLFFAQGLSSIFATHPPLPARIRAVLPNWDGTFEVKTTRMPPPPPPSAAPSRSGNSQERGREMLAGIGVIAAGALARAGRQRESLHDAFGPALTKTDEAVNLAIALLVATPGPVREKQLETIARLWPQADRARITAHADKLESMDPDTRFTVLDVAIAPLRHLDRNSAKRLLDLLQALADADDKLTLAELLVLRGVRRHLQTRINGPDTKDRLIDSPDELAGPISTVLSHVASSGTDNSDTAAAVFAAGVSKQYLLNQSEAIAYREPDPDLRKLDRDLDVLGRSAYRFRNQILNAAVEIVLGDEKVTERELYAIRALALSLGIPVPPL